MRASAHPKKKNQIDEMIQKTLDFANQLTGRAYCAQQPHNQTTQADKTRALLIADATIICDTPIVLLDEVGNARH